MTTKTAAAVFMVKFMVSMSGVAGVVSNPPDMPAKPEPKVSVVAVNKKASNNE